MNKDPIIRLTRVSKKFGQSMLAVDDISLEIQEGEFITFLGPSGCGKSTALKMIAGLLPVTAGKIEITPPSGVSEQDLGFVFQEPTLMPWATVFDNVYLPLRLAGLKRSDVEARVKGILKDVGLTRFGGSYPRELSGGDENAGVNRTCAGDPSTHTPNGRAICGTGRDDPLKTER